MFENKGYAHNKVGLDQQIECNRYVAKVFLTMFWGLLITAAASFSVAFVGPLTAIFMNPISLIVCIIAEFVLVWRLSSKLHSMSYTKAKNMFWIYSILNGITLSSIFYAYDISSIFSAFLVASASFGVMSLYGLSTKKDLTSIGSLMTMGLFGLIILSVINMILRLFIAVTALTWIISILGLVIFLGLTAFDAQKIKNYFFTYSGYGGSFDNESTVNKVGIIGALSLYLDFINIFLFLLRIFGRSSRD